VEQNDNNAIAQVANNAVEFRISDSNTDTIIDISSAENEL